MVTLVGDLPRGPGDTIYRRIGDVFAWGNVALALLLTPRAFANREG
jgi:apolipoprotein N-acyltransferase